MTGKLDAVCTDSCLEFFLAPWSEDARYFNFEFNPLGALYLGFGGERATRVRQVVKDAEKSFAPKPFFTAEGWGIEYRIPVSFLMSRIEPVSLFRIGLATPSSTLVQIVLCAGFLAWQMRKERTKKTIG